MANFHHKVGSDGWQQLRRHGKTAARFTLRAVCQCQGHTMRAMGMDNATNAGVECNRGIVNTPMHGNGFAGLIATDVMALCI